MENLNVMFRKTENAIEMVYIHENTVCTYSIENGETVSSYGSIQEYTEPFEVHTDPRIQKLVSMYILANKSIQYTIVDNVFDVETQWKTLPENVKTILEDITDDTYEQCENAIADLNEINWGGEYGLDGIIYGVYPLYL